MLLLHVENTSSYRNLTLSFGPAHPAAHGVFRLICEFEEEICIKTFNLMGLLWRFTEEIAEARTPDLVNGFFARLDYVSFASQEISFSLHQVRSSALCRDFLLLNHVSNNFLNVSCTLADAGMVGAILWTFEFRELAAELSEETSGARFHSSFSTSFTWDWSRSSLQQIVILGVELVELLTFAGLFSRISRSRLASNLSIAANFVLASGITGALADSSGVGAGELSDFGVGATSALRLFIGGLTSDSWTRHFYRLRQVNAFLVQSLSRNSLQAQRCVTIRD